MTGVNQDVREVLEELARIADALARRAKGTRPRRTAHWGAPRRAHEVVTDGIPRPPTRLASFGSSRATEDMLTPTAVK